MSVIAADCGLPSVASGNDRCLKGIGGGGGGPERRLLAKDPLAWYSGSI